MSNDPSKATGTNERQPASSVIFKFLPELPAPPQKFIDYMVGKWEARDFPEENHSSYARRELKNWKGHNGPAARVQRGAMEGDLQAEFEQWAEENIGPDFISAGAGWLNVDPAVNPPSIGGHTDRTRSVAIGYCIKCGGPDAELTFWREHGHDYLRTTRGLSFDSLENLETVYSTKDFDGCWYFINTHVIHGVENLVEPFIDLAVAFDEIPEKLKSMV